MNKIQVLRELPYAPTKDRILRMYSYESSNYVIKQVNTLLKADGDSVYRKKINHLQFRELIEILGVPRGYKPFLKD